MLSQSVSPVAHLSYNNLQPFTNMVQYFVVFSVLLANLRPQCVVLRDTSTNCTKSTSIYSK